MELFKSIFQPTPDSTILDVGGFSGFWAQSGITSRITILRLDRPEILPPETPSNISSVRGDGCDLKEFADQSFDLVFSNSVIEHVGSFERQQAFAREAIRVGRSVWTQTPAWEFPFEPHVLTPFFHWLPARLQETLFPMTVWSLLKSPKPTPAEVDGVRARLLSLREMKDLFPGAQILVERFCGLPKSYVASLPRSLDFIRAKGQQSNPAGCLSKKEP